MAARPVFHPKLGAMIRTLREAKGWHEQTHAVRIAKLRGLDRITRQVLLRLEAGRTKTPDPDVVRELSELLEVDLMPAVAQAVYGYELLRQPSTSDYSSKGKHLALDEGSPHALKARVLEKRIANTHTKLKSISADIVALVHDLDSHRRSDRAEHDQSGTGAVRRPSGRKPA